MRGVLSEAAFQRAVVEYAELRGWRAFHAPDGKHMARMNATGAGYPDLTLVRGCRLVFAELKTEKGRESEEQREWRRLIHGVGHHAYLWRPSDWPAIEAALR